MKTHTEDCSRTRDDSRADIEGFDSLAELALDMHWTWDHATEEVWSTLDPVLWKLTQNPWVVLQTVSRDRVQDVLAEPDFGKKLDGCGVCP
mgnify:CR=1 FL=1